MASILKGVRMGAEVSRDSGRIEVQTVSDKSQALKSQSGASQRGGTTHWGVLWT